MLVATLVLALLVQDPTRVLGAHPQEVLCLRFASRGSVLLTGTAGGKVRAWDVRRGRLLFEGGEPYASRIRGVDVSKDGKLVSYAVGVGRVVTLDADDGSVEHEVKRDANSDMTVTCIDESDDGRFVWVGDAVGNLVRYYPEDFMKTVQVDLGAGAIVDIAIDPRDKLVAAGCASGTVALVTTNKAEVEDSWKAHEAALVGLGYAKSTLVTAAVDGSVKLWKGSSEAGAIDVGAEILALAVDPKGKWIAVALGSEVRLYGQKKGELAATVPLATKGPMVFDPDGELLAFGGPELRLLEVDDVLP